MGVNKVQYGSQVLLDISDATVTPDTLLAGESAYNAAGEKIAGSLDPMLKSEYGGSGPGIVAMADKANEANTAQSANTAVNAQNASTAQTAQNANTLGGLSLGEIAPDFAASETLMPWKWMGMPVYRQILTIDDSNTTASTAKYFHASNTNENSQTTCNIATATNVLTAAVKILPMTQVALYSGNNYRPMPYNRISVYNYNAGWRLDRNGAGWNFSAELGEVTLSSTTSLVLVAYYTK